MRCMIEIIHVDPDILHEIEREGNRFYDTKAIIEVKEQELKKQKRALEKLHESYEEDMITKQIYMEQKTMRSAQIQKLELRDLRKSVVDDGEFPSVEEIKQRIDGFRDKWSAVATPEEKNKALKKLGREDCV